MKLLKSSPPSGPPMTRSLFGRSCLLQEDEEAALVSGLARKLLPSHETLVDQTHADSYSDGEGLFMIYDCSSRSSPWLWSGFGGFCSPHLELFERVASS